MQENYNARQLLSLGAVIALTPALRLFPARAAVIAGRAGWLAPLMALPLALVWARAMALLLETMQPGEFLPDTLLRLGGRHFGKPALALFAAWCLTYAAFVLRSGADRLVGTVYPGASPALFSQLMGLIALLAALSTPRTLARMGRMLLPLLFGMLGLLLFFALLSADWGNLFPLSNEDVWPLIKTAPVPLGIAAGSGTALCFLAGGEKERRLGFPALAKWSALLCAGLSVLSAAVIGTFGAPLTGQLARPFFVLVRTLVFFRTVERVEALVVMLWVFPDFLMTALFFWAGQYALRLLCGFHPDIKMRPRLDFSEGRVLIWAFAAAATALSLFLAPEPGKLERWSSVYIPAANFTFVFVYLPLLYIVGRKSDAKKRKSL